MNDGRFGIWVIGAWGTAATTAAAGLCFLQDDLISTASLVSEQPKFSRLNLADWKCFVIGGHEIRRTSFLVEARHLLAHSPAFSADLLAKIAPELEAFDQNVRTGALFNVGSAIESRATTAALKTRGERPRIAIDRIAADLAEFTAANSLEHVIVVNLASAEPAIERDADSLSWSELAHVLDRADWAPLAASTLYAIAALKSGCSYINFMPSVGSDLPALYELALATGTLHMGRDGKQGENLLPGVLDLVRLCEREHRRGKSGVMTHLSEFFNDPIGADRDDLCRKSVLLDGWINEVLCER